MSHYYDIIFMKSGTKGDATNGDVKRLLPYSKEAESMDPFVELIQLVATKVLIAVSSPLAI